MKTKIFFSICILALTVYANAQWSQTSGTPQGGGITSMVVCPNGNIVVTCSSFNFPNGQYGGIRYSTNGGNSWTSHTSHYTARTLALGQNGYVWASSWNYPSETEALYRLSANGTVFDGNTYHVGAGNNIFSILPTNNNQTIYIGTRTGVMKSTNGGFNFIAVNNGIPANSWVRDLAVDSAGVLAAATTNGLFISTNSSSSWQQTTGFQAGDTIVKLSFYSTPAADHSGNENFLMAGSDDGIVYYAEGLSTYGVAAILAVFGDDEISAMSNNYINTVEGNYSAITTFPRNNQSSGFSSSTNNGSTWVQYNDGLPPVPQIAASAIGPVNAGIMILIIGLYENTINGARVFKWEKTIGIQKISTEVPEKFSLSQNYPNPFNPSTKISFNISKASNVRLTVFDELGREVSELVNERLSTGTYETDWNASKYSSGIYFYRLSAGEYSETKKMILTK